MTLNPALSPQGDKRSFRHREDRLVDLGYSPTRLKDFRHTNFSPHMTPDATQETFVGTQFDGENHRRHTPIIQMLFEIDRKGLIAGMNGRTSQSRRILDNEFDVAIIGSGPHGAAAAAYLREKYPTVRTVLIEQGARLGGHWASYGDHPSFMLNSRVRRADRRIPSLPRTRGNINPLGTYAPLELSDVVTTAYPMNTDMADVCAVNGYLSATAFLLNTTVTSITRNRDQPDRTAVDLTSPFGRARTIYVRRVIDATGLASRSAIPAPDDMKGYYTPSMFYQHFGNVNTPLERFHGARVAVIGKGDSALTCLEALVGNLPAITYGRSGVGRYQPESIDWLGSFGTTRAEVEACLRTRYKNGIVQSVRRGSTTDGLIRPTEFNVTSLVRSGEYFEVITTDGRRSYPEIVIDCTNKLGGYRVRGMGDDWDPNFVIGPNNGAVFSGRILDTLNTLGIPENNVSLWATMDRTNAVAEAAGAAVVNNNVKAAA